MRADAKAVRILLGQPGAQAELQLLPGRAVFWPQQGALIVADTHFGKSAVFQQHGLAVPSGDTARDLARLTALVEQTQARRLVVLGDLVHGVVTAALRDALEAAFTALAARGVAIDVVVGNHDRQLPALSCAQLHAELTLGPMHCAHEAPATSRSALTLSGHIHPVVAVQGRGRDRLRLPVFWQRGSHLVLPAYGQFTGGWAVEQQADARLWVAGDDDVLALTRPLG